MALGDFTMLRQFIVLVVVVFAAVVLSACGGSNVVENARNAAQELFLPDQGATLNVNGQPMTRPEAVAFWASESAKLVVCESVASKDGVVYINVLNNGAQFSFHMFNNDKPECGMARPWSPLLKSLIDAKAYSTKTPSSTTAQK